MLIRYLCVCETLNSPVTILVERKKKIIEYMCIKKPSQEMVEKTCIQERQHQIKSAPHCPQAEQETYGLEGALSSGLELQGKGMACLLAINTVVPS